MQLRKCCNHPFLFDEEPTDGSIDDEKLVTAAGKMQVLDKMLSLLLGKKHKILIFSQMTRMLDILEDYLILRRYQYCRLDGQTKFLDRQASMDAFNDPTKALQIFLLSTRAGGLGINLTGADTVILYDSDWNPTADNQAQDRCHRIGQTKDVVVYRLIIENSFENRMLQRANAKRTLERVVLTGGEFSSQKKLMQQERPMSMEELEALLRDDITIRSESETGGITPEDVARICDRELVVRAFVKKDMHHHHHHDNHEEFQDRQETTREKNHGIPFSTAGYYVVDSSNDNGSSIA
jgi:SNF2 family DNA or RNA helicase